MRHRARTGLMDCAAMGDDDEGCVRSFARSIDGAIGDGGSWPEYGKEREEER